MRPTIFDGAIPSLAIVVVLLSGKKGKKRTLAKGKGSTQRTRTRTHCVRRSAYGSLCRVVRCCTTDGDLYPCYLSSLAEAMRGDGVRDGKPLQERNMHVYIYTYIPTIKSSLRDPMDE